MVRHNRHRWQVLVEAGRPIVQPAPAVGLPVVLGVVAVPNLQLPGSGLGRQWPMVVHCQMTERPLVEAYHECLNCRRTVCLSRCRLLVRTASGDRRLLALEPVPVLAVVLQALEVVHPKLAAAVHPNCSGPLVVLPEVVPKLLLAAEPAAAVQIVAVVQLAVVAAVVQLAVVVAVPTVVVATAAFPGWTAPMNLRLALRFVRVPWSYVQRRLSRCRAYP